MTEPDARYRQRCDEAERDADRDPPTAVLAAVFVGLVAVSAHQVCVGARQHEEERRYHESGTEEWADDRPAKAHVLESAVVSLRDLRAERLPYPVQKSVHADEVIDRERLHARDREEREANAEGIEHLHPVVAPAVDAEEPEEPRDDANGGRDERLVVRGGAAARDAPAVAEQARGLEDAGLDEGGDDRLREGEGGVDGEQHEHEEEEDAEEVGRGVQAREGGWVRYEREAEAPRLQVGHRRARLPRQVPQGAEYLPPMRCS